MFVQHHNLLYCYISHSHYTIYSTYCSYSIICILYKRHVSSYTVLSVDLTHKTSSSHILERTYHLLNHLLFTTILCLVEFVEELWKMCKCWSACFTSEYRKSTVFASCAIVIQNKSEQINIYTICLSISSCLLNILAQPTFYWPPGACFIMKLQVFLVTCNLVL